MYQVLKMENSVARNAKNWVGKTVNKATGGYLARGMTAAALYGGAQRVKDEGGRPELVKRIRKGAWDTLTGKRKPVKPSERNQIRERKLLSFKEFIEEKNETH